MKTLLFVAMCFFLAAFIGLFFGNQVRPNEPWRERSPSSSIKSDDGSQQARLGRGRRFGGSGQEVFSPGFQRGVIRGAGGCGPSGCS